MKINDLSRLDRIVSDVYASLRNAYRSVPSSGINVFEERVQPGVFIPLIDYHGNFIHRGLINRYKANGFCITHSSSLAIDLLEKFSFVRAKYVGDKYGYSYATVLSTENFSHGNLSLSVFSPGNVSARLPNYLVGVDASAITSVGNNMDKVVRSIVEYTFSTTEKNFYTKEDEENIDEFLAVAMNTAWSFFIRYSTDEMAKKLFSGYGGLEFFKKALIDTKSDLLHSVCCYRKKSVKDPSWKTLRLNEISALVSSLVVVKEWKKSYEILFSSCKKLEEYAHKNAVGDPGV